MSSMKFYSGMGRGTDRPLLLIINIFAKATDNSHPESQDK